jgi:hypothetical protein
MSKAMQAWMDLKIKAFLDSLSPAEYRFLFEKAITLASDDELIDWFEHGNEEVQAIIQAEQRERCSSGRCQAIPR